MVKGRIKNNEIFYTCSICGKAFKDTHGAGRCEATHTGSVRGIKGFFRRLFRKGGK